jgi:tetratricopeptide (TPR) repeat protein
MNQISMNQIRKAVLVLILSGVIGFVSPVFSYAQIESAASAVDQATFHKVKGDFYLRKGNGSLATTEYQEAVRLNPKYSNAYFNMAIAAYSSNNMETAISALEKLVGIDPKDAEVHYNLGCIALYRNNKDKAKHHFEKAKQYASPASRFVPLITQALEFLKEFNQTDASTQETVLFLLSQGLPPVQLS